MKKIWIFNHYAGPPSVTTMLRHYNFAKNLIKNGYPTVIFAASKIHNTNINITENKRKYVKIEEDGIPFIFIRTSDYSGNGFKRILNAIQYYLGLFKVTKNFDRPDVIIGSSAHPLTSVAAIKLAKKYNCMCIVEVRDLWPESIVSYYNISKNNPLICLLYKLEKWIYKKSDKVIFTMEGGKDYIISKGLDKYGHIDLNKVYHINNGVDLEAFEYNKNHFIVEDDDLTNEALFKVIYIGSIRKVNNIGFFIDVAENIKKKDENIKIIIYGDGNELESLKLKCNEKQLDNIVFKGPINKKYVPYILSKADLNIVHVKQTPIMRFGCSLNKLFDYFASGKPILSDLIVNYDLIERYNAGKTISQDSEIFANEILKFKNLCKSDYLNFCNNARKAAYDYDFSKLTQKLLDIINDDKGKQ